jgi:hypothetical protein
MVLDGSCRYRPTLPLQVLYGSLDLFERLFFAERDKKLLVAIRVKDL